MAADVREHISNQVISRLLSGRDHRVSTLIEALDGLAELLNNEDVPDETVKLCARLRNEGCIEKLCAILIEREEPQVLAATLLVLGNLGSDSVDPHANATKDLMRAVDGMRAIMLHLL